MPAGLEKQLVNAVNPRLALYTRAGLLAALILILNYALVAALAAIGMTVCTTSTSTEHTNPTTSGDTEVHEDFAIDLLEREGTVTSGTVTVKTEVSGCATKNVQTIVAPHPETIHAHRYGWWTPEWDNPYEGTGVTVEVPCWNEYLACTDDPSSYNPNALYGPDRTTDTFPCGFYQSPLWLEATTVPEDVIQEVSEAYQRFGWCSSQLEQDAKSSWLEKKELTSVFGGTVNMDQTCGSPWNVAPGGVLGVGLSDPVSVIEIDGFRTIPPWKTYWDVTIETTTTTCPTFYDAFANAFAFTAQIEMVITLVLVFAFKKTGVIKMNEDAVELGEVASRADLRQAQAVPDVEQQQLAPHAPAGAQTFSLTVPDGYGPGMQLTIQHPTTGAQVPVTIPNGVGSGQKFEVRLA